ncbi:MAG: deoxyribodipyrimidine photo-lyase, partial [Pelagibacteraceae bacterium]
MNLLWLRSDLRVNDNIAIKKLLEQKINLKAFYLYDEDKFKDRSAQKWWLYKSLESLEKKLFNLDIKFEIFFEKELVFFEKFIKKNKINKIFWNTIDLPDEKRIENQIISLFKKNNIEFNTFSSNLLQKPEETVKKDGTPFQVFTPFWKNAEEKYVNSKNYSPIETGKVKNKVFKSENIKKIQKILPNKKWYLKFDKYWEPGEDIAENKIKSFLKEKINNYHNTRDIPSIEGTSKISPYLAFGEITSKNIFYQSSKLKDKKTGYRKYINEIGWREFSYHLINHFPKM